MVMPRAGCWLVSAMAMPKLSEAPGSALPAGVTERVRVIPGTSRVTLPATGQAARVSQEMEVRSSESHIPRTREIT